MTQAPDQLPVRVLVVDDHADVRFLVRAILEDAGPAVVHAGEASGAAIGATLSRGIRSSPLRPLDMAGGAIVGAAHHGVDDGGGVGAVAHEVAEQCQAIDAAGARVRETGVERLDVGVDVREQSEAHGAGAAGLSCGPGS